MALVNATACFFDIVGYSADVPTGLGTFDTTAITTPFLSDEVELFSAVPVHFEIDQPKHIHIGATWAGSFTDDFYHRVYVVPQKLDFGVILTTDIKTFLVWNAYFEAHSCTNIDDTAIGTILISGLTAPFNMLPLADTYYTVTVDQQGDSEINNTRTFTFDEGSAPFIQIVGIRSVLFNFEPQREIIETLLWNTNILTPKDGVSAEQRICVQSIPQQRFQWPLVISSDIQRARLNALLFRQLSRGWGLPVWSNSVPHLGEINIDDSVITVDTRYKDFRDDSVGIVWQSAAYHELVRIETVTDSTLTLVSPMTKAFTGPKTIMPVRVAYLESPLRLQDAVQLHSYTQLQFRVTDNAVVSGYTPAVSYRTRPVLLSHSVIDRTTERVINAETTFNDPGIGPFELVPSGLFNVMQQDHGFECKSAAEVFALKQFLCALYGRQKTVWVPSFRNDVLLDQTAAPEDVYLTIQNTSDLALYMQLNELVTHLIFMFTDGQKICRKIIELSSGGTTESIRIDSSLGRQLTADNCRISFLYLCRLTSDQVELKWDKPGHCRTTLNFTVVKDEL
jgi:hypothetical protein